jgi:hypothetical protein
LSFLDTPWIGCYLFVGAVLAPRDGVLIGLMPRRRIFVS